MTTEPEATYEAPAPFPEAGYIVFGIPDVPYSSIRLPLVWNINELNVMVAQSIEAAKLVREAYQEEFGQAAPDRPQSVPDRSQAVPRPAQQARPVNQARNGGLDPALIIEGTCPEHGCKALPSILKFQQIEMSDEGAERYAKYFCPGKDNGTGDNHPLWAREVVPA